MFQEFVLSCKMVFLRSELRSWRERIQLRLADYIFNQSCSSSLDLQTVENSLPRDSRVAYPCQKMDTPTAGKVLSALAENDSLDG